MITYFTDLLKTKDLPKEVDKSRDWYREKASEVDRLNSNDVIRNATELHVKYQRLGHVYLFRYDPKFKDQLPYYDRYPVIIVLNRTSEHTLGLNMHYLPFQFRAALMDQLYNYVTGEEDNAKIKITYDILSTNSRLRFYKPCLRQYLNSQVRSRFVHVNVNEWDTSMFLPLQKFAKKSEAAIHKDSIRKIRNHT